MNYLILSTGRARSGVLCNYLRQIGVGEPDEFYEKARYVLYVHSDHYDVKDWLESKRHNSILGMRMVFSHIRTMYDALGLTLKEFVDIFLPGAKYILQTRDPYLQAIESQLYELDKGKRDRFCNETLKKRVAKIVVQNQAYRNYFVKHKITPVLVDGNDLEKDCLNTMQKVLYQLELNFSADNLKPRFHDAYMNAARDKRYNSVFERFV